MKLFRKKSESLLENFDEKARRTLVAAMEEARRMEHGTIESEHLLLGLLRRDEGIASECLVSSGVTLENVCREVEKLRGPGSAGPVTRYHYSPLARKILQMARRESLQLDDDQVRPEHVLLGIVREPENLAVRILDRLGVDGDQLRREVIAASRTG